LWQQGQTGHKKWLSVPCSVIVGIRQQGYNAAVCLMWDAAQRQHQGEEIFTKNNNQLAACCCSKVAAVVTAVL